MALDFPYSSPLSGLPDSKDQTHPYNEFSEAINLFTSQRKKFGLSLEELSKKTKISRNVLLAIENGWEKYLPETTYLVSMTKILEIELKLEEGSLNGLLIKKVSTNNLSKFQFNFLNIDFINSWVGSLLYLIIMLLSILALNSQQKYLLKINSISTEPALMNDTDIKNEITIKEEK